VQGAENWPRSASSSARREHGARAFTRPTAPASSLMQEVQRAAYFAEIRVIMNVKRAGPDGMPTRTQAMRPSWPGAMPDRRHQAVLLFRQTRTKHSNLAARPFDLADADGDQES